MEQQGKQIVFGAVAALLMLLLVDVILSIVPLAERVLASSKPLPPFGSITNEAQREWLERQKREIAAGEEGEGLLRFDAELGWVVRAGFASDDGLVHSNAAAQRGERAYEAERPEGVTRLACFGDSFTWCPDVRDAWSWEAALEAAHSDWEVINFGVPAFGTGQALLRFRRAGRHDAQVVCIGIMLENICRNVNRYRPLYHPMAATAVAKPRFRIGPGGLEVVPLPYTTRRELVESVDSGAVLEELREHEFFAGPRLPTPLRWSFLTRVAAGLFAYRARDSRRYWKDPSSEPFRVTLDLLETFHREALASGAQAAPVLVFVGPWEIDELASGSRYHHTLFDELARRGVPYVDLVEPIVSASERGDAQDLFAGYHLGRSGNAIVAEELHRWVEARIGTVSE